MINKYLDSFAFQSIWEKLEKVGEKASERIILDNENNPTTTSKVSIGRRLINCIKRLFCCGGNKLHERIARFADVVFFLESNQQHLKVEHLNCFGKISRYYGNKKSVIIKLNDIKRKVVRVQKEELKCFNKENNELEIQIETSKKLQDDIKKFKIKIESLQKEKSSYSELFTKLAVQLEESAATIVKHSITVQQYQFKNLKKKQESLIAEKQGQQKQLDAIKQVDTFSYQAQEMEKKNRMYAQMLEEISRVAQIQIDKINFNASDAVDEIVNLQKKVEHLEQLNLKSDEMQTRIQESIQSLETRKSLLEKDINDFKTPSIRIICSDRTLALPINLLKKIPVLEAGSRMNSVYCSEEQVGELSRRRLEQIDQQLFELEAKHKEVLSQIGKAEDGDGELQALFDEKKSILTKEKRIIEAIQKENSNDYKLVNHLEEINKKISALQTKSNSSRISVNSNQELNELILERQIIEKNFYFKELDLSELGIQCSATMLIKYFNCIEKGAEYINIINSLTTLQELHSLAYFLSGGEDDNTIKLISQRIKDLIKDNEDQFYPKFLLNFQIYESSLGKEALAWAISNVVKIFKDDALFEQIPEDLLIAILSQANIDFATENFLLKKLKSWIDLRIDSSTNTTKEKLWTRILPKPFSDFIIIENLNEEGIDYIRDNNLLNEAELKEWDEFLKTKKNPPKSRCLRDEVMVKEGCSDNAYILKISPDNFCKIEKILELEKGLAFYFKKFDLFGKSYRIVIGPEFQYDNRSNRIIGVEALSPSPFALSLGVNEAFFPMNYLENNSLEAKQRIAVKFFKEILREYGLLKITVKKL